MDQERNENITIEMDGIAFSLREWEDFSWLHPYGKVFYVQDQLTSGNLCFGVEGAYGRLFIKYAGARTVNYTGRREDAVYTLQKAMPLYEKFAHEALTSLRAHGAAGNGYAAIFTWQDAPSLLPIPLHDNKTWNRMRRLQLGRSLKMLEMIYDFHAMTAAEGYIAVDLSETNLLMDFEEDRVILCDIDLYRQKPAVNDRGRMPGSSRLLSPEEYELGAALDERTTVYNLGALAFEFFGDFPDRSRAGWFGPAALYEVARKAIKTKKEERYPSVRAFLKAWREAVGKSFLH